MVEIERRRMRRLVLLVGSALLLVGASAPTSCQPEAKPMSTLYGKVTHASIPAPLDDPPCPLGEAWGYPIEGHREKWGFRIAAADPNEWLSLRPCTRFEYSVVSSLSDTAFTLYTATGDVTGTAAGAMESADGDGVDAYYVQLTVTGGTKAYREASGELYLIGCRQGQTFGRGELRKDRPTNWIDRCDGWR